MRRRPRRPGRWAGSCARCRAVLDDAGRVGDPLGQDALERRRGSSSSGGRSRRPASRRPGIPSRRCRSCAPTRPAPRAWAGRTCPSVKRVRASSTAAPRTPGAPAPRAPRAGAPGRAGSDRRARASWDPSRSAVSTARALARERADRRRPPPGGDLAVTACRTQSASRSAFEVLALGALAVQVADLAREPPQRAPGPARRSRRSRAGCEVLLHARRQHRQRRRDAEHLEVVVLAAVRGCAVRVDLDRWPAPRTSPGRRWAWRRRRCAAAVLEDERRPPVGQVDVEQAGRARHLDRLLLGDVRRVARRSRRRPGPARLAGAGSACAPAGRRRRRQAGGRRLGGRLGASPAARGRQRRERQHARASAYARAARFGTLAGSRAPIVPRREW